MPDSKPIIIVQGAQWGSEAKGAVAARLCQDRQVHYAVRTGAVNAGHTVIYQDWPRKMQQLPTGWVNPKTKLVLGAGAFIHPAVLAEEIRLVSELTGEDIRSRLLVDYRASLHLPEHTVQAQKENRHHSIGATGKGCSVAITDKISKRGKGYRLFKDWLENGHGLISLAGLQFADTVEVLHAAYDAGEQILLEGTQGSLLDLHLGPYPYTTHKQTQAGQWVVEAGLAPGMAYEVVMVARTYPIRVAGNSGPMPKETNWCNLARTINKKLMNRRMGQKVKTWAITEYEQALNDLAHGKWKDKLPVCYDGSPDYFFERWSPADRVQCREAVSEMPAEALSLVGPGAMGELSHLFELTTVTKKLRRVAEWSGAEVAWACRVNRGQYIVLTFFNYVHPELWNHTDIAWCNEYERTVYQVEKDAGIPVKWVTTGPGGEHMINIEGKRDRCGNGR